MGPLISKFPFTLWVVPLEIQLFSNEILWQPPPPLKNSTTNKQMFPNTHILLCGSRQNYIMKSFSQKSTLTCAAQCSGNMLCSDHQTESVRLELRHTQVAGDVINLQVVSVELRNDYHLFIDCPAPRYITHSSRSQSKITPISSQRRFPAHL